MTPSVTVPGETGPVLTSAASTCAPFEVLPGDPHVSPNHGIGDDPKRPRYVAALVCDKADKVTAEATAGEPRYRTLALPSSN